MHESRTAPRGEGTAPPPGVGEPPVPGAEPPGDLHVGDWLVRPSLNRLVRDAPEAAPDAEAAVLQVEPMLIRVLVHLASRPRRVVSPGELLDAVWGARYVSASTVTRAMAELRRLLGDDAHDPRYIETIAKRGYRLIAPVAPAEPRAVAVAVLPLEERCTQPSGDFFAAGLGDELTTELARFDGLEVVSRRSSRRWGGSDLPLPAIARELGADAVVTGSVQFGDGRIRVTAQLVEAATDRALWADSYLRELDDPLTLQGELAGEIARQVAGAVTARFGSAGRRAGR